MKELISYKDMGPKCAFVAMTYYSKRNRFAMNSDVCRIASLLDILSMSHKSICHLILLVDGLADWIEGCSARVDITLLRNHILNGVIEQ